MTLVATAATAAPAATPMPMPLTVFIVCLYIASNLQIITIHLTSPKTAVTFMVPASPLVYAGPREKNSPPGAWA